MEIKNYIGFTLPEPDGSRDTVNETCVLVAMTDEDENGVRQVVTTNPLRHVCAGSDQRSKQFRREFGCHSPSGFNWGYGGSGPADLALCILVDMRLPDKDAWELHQMFKSNVIAQFAQGGAWQLSEIEVRNWLTNTASYKRPKAPPRPPQEELPEWEQRLVSDEIQEDGAEQTDHQVHVNYSPDWLEYRRANLESTPE